jgi:hypothetical protein
LQKNSSYYAFRAAKISGGPVYKAKKIINDYRNARFKLVLQVNHYFAYMKQLLGLILAVLLPTIGWCQAYHFIYVQTDFKQPFYIRFNDKIYSSSESGHLILGRLEHDTTIQFSVGFPKNTFEEQQFKVKVKNDLGFLLKNFGEEGWGLFNLQTLELIKNGNLPPNKKTAQSGGVKKTDAFSTLLANAVNDTAILYAVANEPDVLPPSVETSSKTITALKEEKKVLNDSMSVASAAEKTKDIPKQNEPITITPAPIPEIIKKDTNVIIRETEPTPTTNTELKKDDAKEIKIAPLKEPVLEEKKKDTAPVVVSKPAPEAFNKLPVSINKAAELLTDTSYIAVFVDSLTNDYDTIRISIPFDESQLLRNRTYQKSKSNDSIINDAPPFAKRKEEPVSDINTNPKKIDEQKPVVKPENPIVKTEPPPGKPKEEKSVTKSDESITKISTTPKKTKKEKTVIKAEEPLVKSDPTPVKPKEEKPAIKMEEPVAKNESAPVTPKEDKPTPKTYEPVIKKDSVPTPVKKEAPIPTPVTVSTQDTATTKKKIFMVNSDCQVYAGENDVDKLRVKMLTQAGDDEKLIVARKVLKQRCFTTRHIKALSEIFSTDEGKYRWFDTAYPFVSDPSNFEKAGTVLKDEYFINRFKAMIRRVP